MALFTVCMDPHVHYTTQASTYATLAFGFRRRRHLLSDDHKRAQGKRVAPIKIKEATRRQQLLNELLA